MSYKIPGGQDLSAIFQLWTSPSPKAPPTWYYLNGVDLCDLFACRISTTVSAPLTNYQVNNANYNNADLNTIFEPAILTFDTLYSSYYSNAGVANHGSQTFSNFTMPAGKTGFKFIFCGGGGDGCTATSTSTGSGGGAAFIQTQFPFNAPSGGSYITSIVITAIQIANNTAGNTIELQVNYSDNSVLKFSATGGADGGTAAGAGGIATMVTKPPWWPTSNTASIFYRSIAGPAGAVNGGPGIISAGPLTTTGTTTAQFSGTVSGAASTTSGTMTQTARTTTARPYIFSSVNPIPIGTGGGKDGKNLGVVPTGFGCGGASVAAGWSGIVSPNTISDYKNGTRGFWMFILV